MSNSTQSSPGALMQPVTVEVLIYAVFVSGRGVLLLPWALLVFVSVTVAVARLSYLWVEAPARRWINRRAEPVRAVAGSSETD